MREYDAVVIGAGHAGCEAALACARMGLTTLLITLDMSAVALMPCNPAIGGTGKGHLVREVDALGGQMGVAIDRTFIQSRMLNVGKGIAVHSLRAQADKRRYHEEMLKTLFSQEHLTIRQGEIMEILETNGARIRRENHDRRRDRTAAPPSCARACTCKAASSSARIPRRWARTACSAPKA